MNSCQIIQKQQGLQDSVQRNVLFQGPETPGNCCHKHHRCSII